MLPLTFLVSHYFEQVKVMVEGLKYSNKDKQQSQVVCLTPNFEVQRMQYCQLVVSHSQTPAILQVEHCAQLATSRDSWGRP